MEQNLIGIIQQALGASLSPLGEIANNGKSSIWLVQLGGRKAIVKSLSTEDQRYVATFTELEIYRAFHEEPPVPTVPKLHLVSEQPPALVLEYIASPSLSTSRYPAPCELNANALEKLLAALDSLRRYSGYPLETRDVTLRRYIERWDKYSSRGLYGTTDYHILEALIRNDGWHPEFNHGDPVPSNVLGKALIDWEHGGSYLPFHDIAVVWAASAKVPAIQEMIEERYLQKCGTERLCFAANLLNVASREIWIHTELPEGHGMKADGLALAEPLLGRARAIVRQVL